MNESPLFFPSAGRNLFGVLHSPPGAATGKGFVFCAPFFEEKLWAHRVYVTFARELAARGIHVLRFDYMGHGDSEGSFEESNIDTRIRNILDAASFLTSSGGVREIGLLGLRFGATIAAEAAERHPNQFHRLILWEPALSGSGYMQEMLRINLATQMSCYKEIRVTRAAMADSLKVGKVVNVDGYGLTDSLFRQASKVNLHAGEKQFREPVLIVRIPRQMSPPPLKITELASLYAAASVVTVPEQPFWKEIKPYIPISEALNDTTRHWIEERNG
jgi:exosortase A-associated hydrolase 2